MSFLLFSLIDVFPMFEMEKNVGDLIVKLWILVSDSVCDVAGIKRKKDIQGDDRIDTNIGSIYFWRIISIYDMDIERTSVYDDYTLASQKDNILTLSFRLVKQFNIDYPDKITLNKIIKEVIAINACLCDISEKIMVSLKEIEIIVDEEYTLLPLEVNTYFDSPYLDLLYVVTEGVMDDNTALFVDVKFDIVNEKELQPGGKKYLEGKQRFEKANKR